MSIDFMARCALSPNNRAVLIDGGEMLKPIANSIDLLRTLQRKLGPDRLPLIIGIDGRSGAGKSGLASWLAWQLDMPSVHLDLYIERDSEPRSWRFEDLGRVITARLVLARPIIVEGICLCRPLQAIDRDPDYWVWVESLGGSKPGPRDPTSVYVAEFNPEANADYTLTWKQAEVGFG
jgi:hypothetical protein